MKWMMRTRIRIHSNSLSLLPHTYLHTLSLSIHSLRCWFDVWIEFKRVEAVSGRRRSITWLGFGKLVIFMVNLVLTVA